MRGHDNLGLNELKELGGREVVDSHGEKIGNVGGVWCDDMNHEPEWIGLRSGFLGMQKRFVPIDGAMVDDGKLRLPYEKSMVKNEPHVEIEDDTISPDDEMKLCRYFGITRHPPIETHRAVLYIFE